MSCALFAPYNFHNVDTLRLHCLPSPAHEPSSFCAGLPPGSDLHRALSAAADGLPYSALDLRLLGALPSV